jgi:hypothetical protein
VTNLRLSEQPSASAIALHRCGLYPRLRDF